MKLTRIDRVIRSPLKMIEGVYTYRMPRDRELPGGMVLQAGTKLREIDGEKIVSSYIKPARNVALSRRGRAKRPGPSAGEDLTILAGTQPK